MAENKGFTQTISTADLNETPRLNLEQPTGDVYIEGWDKPEIEVSISDPEGFFEVQQEGANITIRNSHNRPKIVNFRDTEIPELGDLQSALSDAASNLDRKSIERTIERTMRKMSKFGVHLDINLGNWKGGRDYYLKVPHNCHLSLRTSSGDIKITGVTGTLLCQTTSGDLRVFDVGGNLLLSSASGDVGITGLEGNVVVRTASGDIKAREIDANEVGINTASGDLLLDLIRMPTKDIDVRTVSGDLTVHAPYDASFRMETRTISGTLGCGYKREQVKYRPTSKRETTLEVNGGGGILINASSVSGDININPRKDSKKNASADAPSEYAEAANARYDGDRGDRQEPEGYAARKQAELEIFQRVERGELTAQQALDEITRLER